MTDKEKIRSEIERRLKALQGSVTDYARGERTELEKLLSFIDSMKEVLASEDLNKAAELYADKILEAIDPELADTNYHRHIKMRVRIFDGSHIEDAYLDGLKDMKEYLMKDVVEGLRIHRNRYTKKNVLHGLDVTCEAIQKFKDGDKLKLIIIKED